MTDTDDDMFSAGVARYQRSMSKDNAEPPTQRPAATPTGDPKRDFKLNVYNDAGVLVAFYPLYDCPVDLDNEGYWTVTAIHGDTKYAAGQVVDWDTNKKGKS